MAALTTTLEEVFTPAVGVFAVQCTVGLARLERRNVTGAAWAPVGDLAAGQAADVDNSVADMEYRFVAREPFGDTSTPVIRADQ